MTYWQQRIEATSPCAIRPISHDDTCMKCGYAIVYLTRRDSRLSNVTSRQPIVATAVIKFSSHSLSRHVGQTTLFGGTDFVHLEKLDHWRYFSTDQRTIYTDDSLKNKRYCIFYFWKYISCVYCGTYFAVHVSSRETGLTILIWGRSSDSHTHTHTMSRCNAHVYRNTRQTRRANRA